MIELNFGIKVASVDVTHLWNSPTKSSEAMAINTVR